MVSDTMFCKQDYRRIGTYISLRRTFLFVTRSYNAKILPGLPCVSAQYEKCEKLAYMPRIIDHLI
jgi:hypothetical protein